MTTSPTLHLRERRPRLCRLSGEEVRFLLEHHRSHLDLAPTSRRHVWRLTPAGFVGVILTPRRRIVISPKIPLRNLLLLLDPQADGEPDRVGPAEGSEVIEILAARLAGLMSERAAAGLHRDYRETPHQGPYLVGQLDLAAQLRQPPGRREQIHSRHDEYTAELPMNQVPRTLAARLLTSGLVGPAVRSLLTQALASFAQVGETVLTPDVLAALGSGRIPGSYRPLLDLCLLLADGLAPGVEAGAAQAQALLVSLERWFEQYVTRAVEEAFAGAGLSVSVQRTRLVSRPAADRPDLAIRPDLTVDRGDRPVLAIDAKWKRLADAGPQSDDLYQALAYAGLLGTERAVLVYPGRRRPRHYTFTHSPLRLEEWSLDVSGPPDRCRRGRERLGRALRRWSVEPGPR